MKSFALLSISSLAALVVSSPDHFQSVPSVLCTDVPAQTVTVTQDCAPCQTGAPGSGSGSGSGSGGGDGSGSGSTGGSGVVTVTVTETVTTTATPETTLPPSTMTLSVTDITTTSTTSSAPGSQQTFNVDVGAFTVDGTNQTVFEFRPNNITNAHVGDLVLFNMLGANHSVTQSQFAFPCIKNGSFDTGFVANPQNTSDAFVQSFTVNVTTPLWFYCRQTGHCGKGMVFGINPKNQTQMQQFIDMAKAQNGTNSTTGSGNGTSTTTAPFATITVGTNNGTGLVFDPPVLPYVPPNNTIRFEFHAKNHTLTESSFASPCTKSDKPNAIDTGFANFNPLDMAPFSTFDVAVEDTTPRFFYCMQTVAKSHCNAGMVFGLNVGHDQFAQFQQAAKAVATPVASATPVPARKRSPLFKKW